jgi:hypothetical protein
MLSHRPVNICSSLQKFLLALCVLAVMTAQLFGMGRGFLCDCSGAPVAVAHDHCHGPHGAHCLENEEPAHPIDSHPDDGDTHPHERVVQDFQSAPAPAAECVLTEPFWHVVLMLDDAVWVKTAPLQTVEYVADERGSPPCGVAVARTVVLLI